MVETVREGLRYLGEKNHLNFNSPSKAQAGSIGWVLAGGLGSPLRLLPLTPTLLVAAGQGCSECVAGRAPRGAENSPQARVGDAGMGR